LVLRVLQMCEITHLPVGGLAPHHPCTCAVKKVYHTVSAFESTAVCVPLKYLIMIHRLRLQFVRPDREIREPLPYIALASIEDYLASVVRCKAVCQSSCWGQLLC